MFQGLPKNPLQNDDVKSVSQYLSPDVYVKFQIRSKTVSLYTFRNFPKLLYKMTMLNRWVNIFLYETGYEIGMKLGMKAWVAEICMKPSMKPSSAKTDQTHGMKPPIKLHMKPLMNPGVQPVLAIHFPWQSVWGMKTTYETGMRPEGVSKSKIDQPIWH